MPDFRLLWYLLCSQQPWTSHVCHFDSCSTNYLQWRQLYSWYVGEIECMIQLQHLVLYEVIRICLEHPCHTSICNEFTTWTAFEGWGHGSSTVNLTMLRTHLKKNSSKFHTHHKEVNSIAEGTFTLSRSRVWGGPITVIVVKRNLFSGCSPTYMQTNPQVSLTIDFQKLLLKYSQH
jgi:hypothetical protein